MVVAVVALQGLEEPDLLGVESARTQEAPGAVRAETPVPQQTGVL
jgi:hypothetical protein